MKPIFNLIGLLLVLTVYSLPAQAVLPGVDASGKPFPSLAPMLRQVNPAVVNISTFSTREADQNPLLNDPFFRRFFNLPETPQPDQQLPRKRQQSAGSGVIVGANRRKVSDMASLEAALRDSGDSILLHVDRDGGSLFIVIR